MFYTFLLVGAVYHARIVPPSYPRPSDCPRGPFRFPPVAVGKPTRRSVPILCFFQCSKLSFSSERLYLRELFRHRTPVLRTAPGGHFASLRSRSVNRLAVLLLSYSVFQCSKLSFSSERSYLRELFRHRTPVLRTAPGGHFASLRSRSVYRLAVLFLSYFQCSKLFF